ncbi:TPA: isoprenylcysteine carboxylmethyltransferase family protein [Candidatus Bathyarchaeota archaeon]|nr:isoprenylcysteine carboxylmethyltransferase family protein [Candidatus Bathyarchaeota archaeon]
MYLGFLVCLFGVIAMVPLHLRSLEHIDLQKKYGPKRGTRIGETFGLISGWGFFGFWIGVWVSPQPRFALPFFTEYLMRLSFLNLQIPLVHIVVSFPFLVIGCWLGIQGVKTITLKASETHKTEKIITVGVYSIVRHPQYLGGLLSHVGITFLLSSLYSLMVTPLVVFLIYLIALKEEEELIKEFGEEYLNYKRRVPMLMPKLR